MPTPHNVKRTRSQPRAVRKPTASPLTIGEVAHRTGVAASTLRYYETVGLLPVVARVGGQRRYDEAVLGRLRLIRLCKAAGFALAEIAQLVGDEQPGRPASKALARSKLSEIDTRIAELGAARRIIETGMACTCPSITDCSCRTPQDLPAP